MNTTCATHISIKIFPDLQKVPSYPFSVNFHGTFLLLVLGNNFFLPLLLSFACCRTSYNWNHEIFVLWVGLISFSTFSKFTCVVTCIRISLLFMVEYYHIVCIYYILFVHWSVESSQFYFIIFLYLLFGCKGLSYST